jgi:hypothetical protein
MPGLIGASPFGMWIDVRFTFTGEQQAIFGQQNRLKTP